MKESGAFWPAPPNGGTLGVAQADYLPIAHQRSGLRLLHPNAEMPHPEWKGWSNPPEPPTQHWYPTVPRVTPTDFIALHTNRPGGNGSLDRVGGFPGEGQYRCNDDSIDGVRPGWPEWLWPICFLGSHHAHQAPKDRCDEDVDLLRFRHEGKPEPPRTQGLQNRPPNAPGSGPAQVRTVLGWRTQKNPCPRPMPPGPCMSTPGPLRRCVVAVGPACPPGTDQSWLGPCCEYPNWGSPMPPPLLDGPYPGRPLRWLRTLCVTAPRFRVVLFGWLARKDGKFAPKAQDPGRGPPDDPLYVLWSAAPAQFLALPQRPPRLTAPQVFLPGSRNW